MSTVLIIISSYSGQIPPSFEKQVEKPFEDFSHLPLIHLVTNSLILFIITLCFVLACSASTVQRIKDFMTVDQILLMRIVESCTPYQHHQSILATFSTHSVENIPEI